MSHYRRHGARGIVALVVGVSLIASILAAIMSVKLTSGSDAPTPQETAAYLAVAVLVPHIIAPVATTLLTRLLIRLDEALAVMVRLSTTDALTGVANRRGFFSSASQSIHALRGAKGCLVVMIDLDRCKQLNDSYGHNLGDAALQLLAQKLEQIGGDRGMVGRLGGDEFGLYLLGDEGDLQFMQDRLEQACKSLTLDVEAGPSVTFSASVGVAQLGAEEKIDEALSRADTRLYESKRARVRSSARSETEKDGQPSLTIPASPGRRWLLVPVCAIGVFGCTPVNRH